MEKGKNYIEIGQFSEQLFLLSSGGYKARLFIAAIPRREKLSVFIGFVTETHG